MSVCKMYFFYLLESESLVGVKTVGVMMLPGEQSLVTVPMKMLQVERGSFGV